MKHLTARSVPGTAGRALLVAVLLAVPPAQAASAPATATVRGAPLVSVAGDIACGPNVDAFNAGNGTATQCRQKYTSRLILASDAVWTLGDHAYPNATLANLRTAYTPTWGRKRIVTYPTPGDHDYDNETGKGYYSYFGRRPYYSFAMGGWRVFSLNSEIDHSASSPQVRWLNRKLSTARADCLAAYWSTPRWTSGPKAPGNSSFKPFLTSLYAERADLVLTGDSHHYERFALQTPAGVRSATGVRQFVVGTGGRNLVDFPDVQPNSQVRRKVFGVLQLRLRQHSYAWRFLDQGRRTRDSGVQRCH